MLLADEQIDWSDTEADGPVYWMLTDHLGSVRDVVDNNGTVRRHNVFDSYGNRLNADAIDATIEWTGVYRDPITGLQWNRARWYNPEIQRWMSEDPIKDGFNWQIYVENGPTMFVDPSGLFPIPVHLLHQRPTTQANKVPRITPPVKRRWPHHEQGTFSVYILKDPGSPDACNSDVDVQYRVSNRDILVYEKIELRVYTQQKNWNFIWGISEELVGIWAGREDWHLDIPKPNQGIQDFPLNHRGPIWQDRPGKTMTRAWHISFFQEWEAQAWGLSKCDGQWHLIKTIRWGHRSTLKNGKYQVWRWVTPPSDQSTITLK